MQYEIETVDSFPFASSRAAIRLDHNTVVCQRLSLSAELIAHVKILEEAETRELNVSI